MRKVPAVLVIGTFYGDSFHFRANIFDQIIPDLTNQPTPFLTFNYKCNIQEQMGHRKKRKTPIAYQAIKLFLSG